MDPDHFHLFKHKENKIMNLEFLIRFISFLKIAYIYQDLSEIKKCSLILKNKKVLKHFYEPYIITK